jgi:hypothetical protein
MSLYNCSKNLLPWNNQINEGLRWATRVGFIVKEQNKINIFFRFTFIIEKTILTTSCNLVQIL